LPKEPVQAGVADKGYDAEALVVPVTARGAAAVMAPRKHRTQPREYDRHVYQERPLIECCSGKSKHSRRIFSRFQKTARHSRGFLCFVAALVGLR
jgi:transposase